MWCALQPKTHHQKKQKGIHKEPVSASSGAAASSLAVMASKSSIENAAAARGSDAVLPEQNCTQATLQGSWNFSTSSTGAKPEVHVLELKK